MESATNDYTTNLYIGVTPRLSRPQDYKVETPRNHGGERQRCPHCHSDQLQRKVIMTCMQCGSVLEEKISLVNQGSHLDVAPDEYTRDAAVTQNAVRNVNLTTSRTNDPGGQLDVSAETVLQEPATPPVGDVDQSEAGDPLDSHDDQALVHEQNDEHPQEQCSTQADVLKASARLLLDMAGPEPVHIEMSARGPKKYYEMHRPLTEHDTRAHLLGWKTTGACLRHPAGMTRALCYDADTSEDWQYLVEAAQLLPYGDYQPLLEPSPVQAGEHAGGGHLWIIFDGLVKASWAKQHVVQFAPSLRRIQESWPGSGNHKVRLPGGKYVKPGFAAWCALTDGEANILATDGLSAARVLLASQTPAARVPAYPASEAVGPCPGSDSLLKDDHQVQAEQEKSLMQIAPAVDARWQGQYGRFLWFQFTPAQVAAWYNQRSKVQALLPPEENGMGLASWRGEQTASVGLREDGWVDFGASVRRADGKQDGGDALELTVRITEEPKAEVMRELARQLVSEAREAMERAAHGGEQPPPWVQAFMSQAGWEHYHHLLEEAGHSDQAITESAPHIGGGTGCASPDNDAPTNSTHPGQEEQQGQRQVQQSVQAVPSSTPMQALAMLEAIKDYGQACEWAALVVEGEEIIPAGRSNWLQFVWLSHNKEQQRRVYAFIEGGSAREEATTFRLDAARPSVLEDNRTINFVNGWSK